MKGDFAAHLSPQSGCGFSSFANLDEDVPAALRVFASRFSNAANKPLRLLFDATFRGQHCRMLIVPRLSSCVQLEFFAPMAARSAAAPARWRRPFLVWLDGIEAGWAIPLLIVGF